MKKTLIPIMIVIVFVICAVVVWWIVTDKEEIKKQDIEIEKEEVKSEKVEKKETKEEIPPRILLSLDINGRERGEILQGTPLFINVTLRNASAWKAAQTRDLIKYYSAEEFSEQEKENKNKILQSLKNELEETPDQPVTLRSDLLTLDKWISFELLSEGEYLPIPWPKEVLKSPEGRQISLGEKMTRLEYGLSPEVVKEISPGEYKIRVCLMPELASVVKDGLNSDPVSITILGEDRATEEMLKRRVYLTGQYYLKKGDLARAEEFVQSLVEQNPKSISGSMLLGDIKEEMKQEKEAFLFYLEAMNVIAENESEAPPPELVQKINQYLYKSKK